MLPAGINGATGQVHVDDDRVILGLSDKVAIASDEIAVGLEAVGLERRTGAGIRWSRTRGATTTSGVELVPAIWPAAATRRPDVHDGGPI